MGLFTRIKDWDDGDILTEPDLEAEFDNIYDSVVAGTTAEVGMVQLEDSHASTSITKAACPKNVKEAYDLADTMITKATFDAHSVIKADSDNIPIVLAVAASRLIGRKASGGIDDLAKADVHTILNIEDGATKYPDTGEQAFLDADHTKLNGIETSATADQTKTDIDGLGLSHDSLSDVSVDDHHAQSHNAASHSDITSTGANIDDAVTKKHAATLIGTKTIDETDIANTKVIAYNSTSGNLEYEAAGTPGAHKTTHENGGADEISVTGLSGLLADDQHVLDTEVKAAAVSDAAYAAGWNGVTDVAASKNALYDKISTMGGGGEPDAHRDSHDPNDGSDPLETAPPAEISVVVAAAAGTAHSLARSDHVHAISHAITNNHLVTIDHTAVADNDYAKFTASGLEGRSPTEVRSDLNVEDGATADNISDANVTDLTDGFDTTLHDHDGISENTNARHTQGTDTGLGTMTADINMGTHKITALSAPSAAGHSLRATASITETAMEDAITKKHAATLIGTKTIDETDIANTKVIAYNSTSGNLEYEAAGTPDAHAATHITGGGDTIANAVAAGNAGLMTGTDKTKLNGIEAAADITDVTNVNAAGAVMESDYNANTFLYAVSDDTPVVKTRAETLALLSGQAGASFDMNSQAITKLSNIVTTHTPGAAGTATLDLDVSRIHDITMPAGNITIAISNENNGDIFTIRILQDGTGSRTVTWFSTIKWAGGSAPTLTTTANKADTVIFRVTGTDTYDGFVVGQNI